MACQHTRDVVISISLSAAQRKVRSVARSTLHFQLSAFMQVLQSTVSRVFTRTYALKIMVPTGSYPQHPLLKCSNASVES